MVQNAKKKRSVRRAKWRITQKTWEALNWARSSKAIAVELDVTPQAVYRAAKRFGKTDLLLNGHLSQCSKADWANLPDNEWTLTNADLGRRYDVTREIVRRKRKRYAPDDLKESPRK